MSIETIIIIISIFNVVAYIFIAIMFKTLNDKVILSLQNQVAISEIIKEFEEKVDLSLKNQVAISQMIEDFEDKVA